jgi:hypothetical protein
MAEKVNHPTPRPPQASWLCKRRCQDNLSVTSRYIRLTKNVVVGAPLEAFARVQFAGNRIRVPIVTI